MVSEKNSDDNNIGIKKMIFKKTKIEGAWVIDPELIQDMRGHFKRAWCKEEFTKNNIDFIPVQTNMVFSIKAGTIRGMHFQENPAIEAKLVRCTKGKIYDVVLDIRQDSMTFGQWFATELSAENGRMLLIPERCAHGCQSLVNETEIYYMASEFYTPAAVNGIRFDDPAFNIRWPLDSKIVSEQDRNWPPYRKKES